MKIVLTKNLLLHFILIIHEFYTQKKTVTSSLTTYVYIEFFSLFQIHSKITNKNPIFGRFSSRELILLSHAAIPF